MSKNGMNGLFSEQADIIDEITKNALDERKQDNFRAASALEHDLTLVTRNTKHYQRIVNLNYPLHLENWRNPC